MGTRLLATMAALLLTAACTPTRWEHPSLPARDDPELRADLGSCRALAERQALASGGFYGEPRYRRVRGRDGKYYLERDPLSGPEFGSPTSQRWRHEDECMRAKGYQLVPATR
ncbi:MAG: hypothetical protein EXQ87_01545 [Alphaproteobacteria bacterium]|nr:hypothetical protein [Alphaproteobacteria bacterium]